MRVIKEYSQPRVIENYNIKQLEELIKREEANAEPYYPTIQIKGQSGYATKWMSISIDELKDILDLWKKS